MRKYIIPACLLFLAASTKAQDFHLSQYDMTPQYMNPALTGMYGGEKADYKIFSDYRSQWSNAAVNPFSTAYLAYDMSTEKWGKDFGFGAMFVHNRSGISSMNTTGFMLSAAYNITANSGGKHMLTTGLQLGIMHKGFDPDNLTYDAQYSEALGGFDTGLPNGETPDRSSVTAFDASCGIYYKYTEANSRYNPFGGFSVYHVTRPDKSFTSTPVKMPMRFNLHGGCDVTLTQHFVLTPRFLFMSQAHAEEINVGLLTQCSIPNSPYTALLQTDCRNGDAIILGLGMKVGQHAFRVSYDINTSSLNNYLDGNGSWEFSLVLTGVRGKSFFGLTASE